MKVEIKYIFECKDGFRFVRDTPHEIMQVVDENYNALRDMAKDGDSVNMFRDYTNYFMPKATISAYIGGTWKYYELKTETIVLT